MKTPIIRLFIVLITILGLSACLGPSASIADAQSTSTPIVVRILDLDRALEAPIVPPTETEQPSPTNTPVLLPSPTPLSVNEAGDQTLESTETPSCINRAEFIRHLTISDNTALEAGQAFTKIWQIQNTGTCEWTTAYKLIFFSGDPMNGTPILEFPENVPPGGTIDLKVNLIAPFNMATHTGNWVLSDPSGAMFGVGDQGNQPITVVIQVKPTPKPSPG